MYIVPTPTIVINADSSNNFTKGTERSVTCDITLNPPSPTNPNVTLEWIKNGYPFDNSTDRVIESPLNVSGNTYSSTIIFSPLNTTDGGDYQCIGTVRTGEAEENILSSTNNGSLSFSVEGTCIIIIIIVFIAQIKYFAYHFIDVPDYDLTLTANETGNLNEPYSLICRVNLADGLIGFSMNVTIEKLTNGTYEVLQFTTGSSVEISLSSLTNSDAGMYRCSADVRHDVIEYQKKLENFINISVTSMTFVRIELSFSK